MTKQEFIDFITEKLRYNKTGSTAYLDLVSFLNNRKKLSAYLICWEDYKFLEKIKNFNLVCNLYFEKVNIIPHLFSKSFTDTRFSEIYTEFLQVLKTSLENDKKRI